MRLHIMDYQSVITAVLSLVAGVGVFLVACGMLSSSLEALGSKKLKGLFSVTSKSKLVGVGAGAAVTAAVQSSSATTVMVIGFVNAGIMPLAQAATIIFGANVGTTITGQIVALGLSGGSGISVSAILAAFAGVGAFMLTFAKKDSAKKLGGIFAGFGMIFVGLSLMSASMKNFAALDGVRAFLASFNNPLLLVITGALLTAAVQSSSVMTSMAITMTVTGLITLNQGIYITMGSNVGTCVTAIIASLSGGRNAKRAALIHLIFNVGGSLLFMLAGLFMRLGGWNYGLLFERFLPLQPQIQLAAFHTLFNVITVIVILPFTNALVKAVIKIIPDRKDKEERKEPRLYFIDDNMLKTPPVALGQVKNEIVNMAEIATENFCHSCDMARTLDFSKLDTFKNNERTLNFLNENIAAFMVKLLRMPLSERDRIFISTSFRSISDLERVGDYAENIVEYAEKLKADGESFSPEAKEEIARLKILVTALFNEVIKAYKNGDREALKTAFKIEDEVDGITAEMNERHIQRLNDGRCTPAVGAQYLNLSVSVERIADHLLNVGKTIRKFT